MGDITLILQQVNNGDANAADRLLAEIYDELRRLAANKLSREKPGHTLQATALVHEAYIRLLGNESGQFQNSAYFFASAAEAMRRILVESARRKARIKHGGGREKREVHESDAILLANPLELLALDEALEKLTREDSVKAELVKLRYFAGLTIKQAAEVLKISRATADRYWTFARSWLYDEMSQEDPAE